MPLVTLGTLHHGMPCRYEEGLCQRSIQFKSNGNGYPNPNQEHMDAVAALMADGKFLNWEFNVFDLEDHSGGHSLW